MNDHRAQHINLECFLNVKLKCLRHGRDCVILQRHSLRVLPLTSCIDSVYIACPLTKTSPASACSCPLTRSGPDLARSDCCSFTDSLSACVRVRACDHLIIPICHTHNPAHSVPNVMGVRAAPAAARVRVGPNHCDSYDAITIRSRPDPDAA